MYRIGNFFNLFSPLTLGHCNSKLEIPTSERFRFLQISHFLHSLLKTKPSPPNITPYKHWCTQAMEQRGGIFMIYKSLSRDNSKPSYMTEWERDLSQDWDLEEWYDVASRAYQDILNVS